MPTEVIDFRVNSRLPASVVLGCALWCGGAWGGGVVAISDGKVGQYREAVGGARETARGLVALDASAPDLSDQVHKADPSVVISVGQRALQRAQEVAPGLPTVYCMVFEWTVTSSPSLTGVPLDISAREQLSKIKLTDPAVRRIGVFYDPRTHGAFVSEAGRAASSLGLTLVAKPVADVKEVRNVVAEMAPGVDALLLVPDPALVNKELFNYLLVFTLERKLALFGFLDSFTQAGALASFAPDYADIGRRAGALATEIAKKPMEKRIPVPAVDHSPGALTINLKTAEQLGIDVPSAASDAARQVYR